MKVLLIDKRSNFRSDVNNYLIIDDECEVEVVSDMGTASGLEQAVSRFQPDAIIVADNVFHESDKWLNIGVPVVGYIANRNNPDIFAEAGVASFGVITSARQLLNLLEDELPVVSAKREPPMAPNKTVEKPAQRPADPAPVREKSSQKKRPVMWEEDDEEDEIPYVPEPKRMPVAEPVRRPARTQGSSFQNVNTNGAGAASVPSRKADLRSAPELKEPPVLPVQKSLSTAEKLRETQKTHYDSVAEQRLKRDLEARNVRNTKVSAVYAAKGGVGKTTIATELAVYLSLVSSGRENFRVCLVDYNIDFGDVLTTLNLDSRGKNLTFWAAEIRERMEEGEDPTTIQYTTREIENYLQRYNNSSLYVLVAPIVHEDSMDIQSEELECILRNIAENGDFDFVICDTGNNTRDSTVIALDAAQDIFLIATQDVSAVSCDKAFLQTMIKIGFDTSKIRLVINNIMPYKYTQVTVKEVEDMFEYSCIARFKRNPDVTKANNCSEPIVYQPNHEFTKELRNVVSYLLGQNTTAAPKKKGIFAKRDKNRRS